MVTSIAPTPYGAHLAKYRQRFAPNGVKAFSYLNNVKMAILGLTAAVAEKVAFLKDKSERTCSHAERCCTPLGGRHHWCSMARGGSVSVPYCLTPLMKWDAPKGGHQPKDIESLLVCS